MATFELSDATLMVDGNLDHDAEREFKEYCARLVTLEAESVTLDLREVTSINSVSIGHLVALCMDLRDAGKRAILQPSRIVTRILEMTGLTETFAQAARPLPEKPRVRSKKAQF